MLTLFSIFCSIAKLALELETILPVLGKLPDSVAEKKRNVEQLKKKKKKKNRIFVSFNSLKFLLSYLRLLKTILLNFCISGFISFMDMFKTM